MFAKFAALMEVMRFGQEVADPAKWKSRQVSSNAIAGALLAGVALAKSFGIHLPIDEETAYMFATGGLAITNAILTIVTSKKIGIKG